MGVDFPVLVLSPKGSYQGFLKVLPNPKTCPVPSGQYKKKFQGICLSRNFHNLKGKTGFGDSRILGFKGFNFHAFHLNS
jgi:hypothetical protein